MTSTTTMSCDCEEHVCWNLFSEGNNDLTDGYDNKLKFNSCLLLSAADGNILYSRFATAS